MMCRIAPSLASAPLDRLAAVVDELVASGADMLHFDVEDGVFVPVMTLGTKIIGDLRPLTTLPFDVHLMMVNPEWLLPELAELGADRVTVHIEACPYPRRVLRQIVELGMQAGLAFNPVTSIPDLAYLLPYLSIVNILTTEPEIPDSPPLLPVFEKVREGRARKGLDGIEWIVDGGISEQTIAAAVRAGADTVVAGRAVFEGADVSSNLIALRAYSSQG